MTLSFPSCLKTRRTRYKNFWGRFRSSSSQSLGESSVGEKDEIKSELQSPSSLEALTEQFIGKLEVATGSPTDTQPLPSVPLTVPLVQPATVTQDGAQTAPALVAPNLAVPTSLTVPVAHPVQPATVTQGVLEATAAATTVAANLAPPTVSPGALPGSAAALPLPSTAPVLQGLSGTPATAATQSASLGPFPVPLAPAQQPATVTQVAPEAAQPTVAASLAPPTVSPGALPGSATAKQEALPLPSTAPVLQGLSGTPASAATQPAPLGPLPVPLAPSLQPATVTQVAPGAAQPTVAASLAPPTVSVSPGALPGSATAKQEALPLPSTAPVLQGLFGTPASTTTQPAPLGPFPVPLAPALQPATVTQVAPGAAQPTVAASLAPPTVSPGALPGSASAEQQALPLPSTAPVRQGLSGTPASTTTQPAPLGPLPVPLAPAQQPATVTQSALQTAPAPVAASLPAPKVFPTAPFATPASAATQPLLPQPVQPATVVTTQGRVATSLAGPALAVSFATESQHVPSTVAAVPPVQPVKVATTPVPVLAASVQVLPPSTPQEPKLPGPVCAPAPQQQVPSTVQPAATAAHLQGVAQTAPAPVAGSVPLPTPQVFLAAQQSVTVSVPVSGSVQPTGSVPATPPLATATGPAFTPAPSPVVQATVDVAPPLHVSSAATAPALPKLAPALASSMPKAPPTALVQPLATVSLGLPSSASTETALALPAAPQGSTAPVSALPVSLPEAGQPHGPAQATGQAAAPPTAAKAASHIGPTCLLPAFAAVAREAISEGPTPVPVAAAPAPCLVPTPRTRFFPAAAQNVPACLPATPKAEVSDGHDQIALANGPPVLPPPAVVAAPPPPTKTVKTEAPNDSGVGMSDATATLIATLLSQLQQQPDQSQQAQALLNNLGLLMGQQAKAVTTPIPSSATAPPQQPALAAVPPSEEAISAGPSQPNPPLASKFPEQPTMPAMPVQPGEEAMSPPGSGSTGRPMVTGPASLPPARFNSASHPKEYKSFERFCESNPNAKELRNAWAAGGKTKLNAFAKYVAANCHLVSSVLKGRIWVYVGNT